MLELIIRGVPVQRGPQSDQMSYIASLTFSDIARLLTDGRLYVPNETNLPDLAQRKLNPVRVKAIAQYILETYPEGSTFFPPICLNVHPIPTYKDGAIALPYHEVTMRLTDGQHRCCAIRKAIEQIQSERLQELPMVSKLEIGVLLYAGLPLELERQAFRDQNLLAQRPGVSLSHLFDGRSPSVQIAKELMQRVPQFVDNVEVIENGLGTHNPKLLTLSTLVSATKSMFPNLRSKKDLDRLTEWAEAFWVAVASVLPKSPWETRSKEDRDRQRQESLVVSAVTFQTLGCSSLSLAISSL
ncbi:DNA sulfur modification protein DndB [Tumidithrix helvetica PCC 7403]|uniref:DNA sulfur modification protein DndB n=1 Tax=Tumidithrix helvetica TaxID=3457545 RepID=UPI003C80E073